MLGERHNGRDMATEGNRLRRGGKKEKKTFCCLTASEQSNECQFREQSVSQLKRL